MDSRAVTCGTSCIIIKSGSGKENYSGPSKYIKSQLKKVGLKLGYNEKYDVFIMTSHNSWEQGPGSMCQFDHWKLFWKESFTKTLLENCIIPS